MRSDADSTTVDSHVPEFTPDTFTDLTPVSAPDTVSAPNTARAREAAEASKGTETRAEYLRRKSLRGRLHGYAIATVALVAVLIALAASNTARVKVNWIVGTSHVSLVWLVLVTAIVAWLLGLMASARFNWRTRAPQRPTRTWSWPLRRTLKGAVPDSESPA
jgi:uncharacterized integral membrane protein